VEALSATAQPILGTPTFQQLPTRVANLAARLIPQSVQLRMLRREKTNREKAIELCKWEGIRSCRNNPNDCIGNWAVSGNNTLAEVIGVSEPKPWELLPPAKGIL
jgi:hypothetical protein